MNSKQLANVLIKVLGLSILAHSIPGILNGILSALVARGVGAGGNYWLLYVSPVASAAIGIWLLIQSRSIAEFLFRSGDE